MTCLTVDPTSTSPFEAAPAARNATRPRPWSSLPTSTAAPRCNGRNRRLHLPPSSGAPGRSTGSPALFRTATPGHAALFRL